MERIIENIENIENNIEIIDDKDNKKNAKFKRNIAVIIILIILTALMCVLIHGWVAGNSSVPVYVQTVSDINVSAGNISRFSGIVQSPERESVKYDDSMPVKEILVEAGDEVKKGDTLFEYDTENISIELEQLQMEISSLKDDVNTASSKIKQLEKDSQSAETAADRMLYDAQLQALQSDIDTGNFTIKAKQAEASRLQVKIKGASVKASSNGVVVSINDAADNNDEIISIMTDKDPSVECEVNEQNLNEIKQDMKVVVRSRANGDAVWKGKISNIGTAQSNSDSLYNSARYRFTVALDKPGGLLIGQHMIVETDKGQYDKRSGVWLNKSWFIEIEEIDDEKENDDGKRKVISKGSEIAYVWMENDDGRLKKQEAVLGDYNKDLDLYEVIEGLSKTDRIAWPDEVCREGAECIPPA